MKLIPALYIYHFSTVVGFSSEKYSGSSVVVYQNQLLFSVTHKKLLENICSCLTTYT